MIRYQKILELYFNGYSQRTISNVIKRIVVHKLTELTQEMTDEWLSGLLFQDCIKKFASKKSSNYGAFFVE